MPSPKRRKKARVTGRLQVNYDNGEWVILGKDFTRNKLGSRPSGQYDTPGLFQKAWQQNLLSTCPVALIGTALRSIKAVTFADEREGGSKKSAGGEAPTEKDIVRELECGT